MNIFVVVVFVMIIIVALALVHGIYSSALRFICVDVLTFDAKNPFISLVGIVVGVF